MKNLLKAFGIIALVAVIGFSMAACEREIDCQVCGGSGICVDCGGTGKPTASKLDACFSCGGSGKCSNCHGTGKEKLW
jgi:hypothetical protein